MPDLRTKLKQHYLGLLLFSAIMPTAAFGTTSSIEVCNGTTSSIEVCNGNAQCERFISLGFSMDIAWYGDAIQTIMDITNIEPANPITHSRKSFINAIDSNWSPHNSDTQFSEHNSILSSSVKMLGMHFSYNELPPYIPRGSKLRLFILGSHPRQLCSLLYELNRFNLPIHKTILIGSSVPIYTKDDFANCAALSPKQKKQLQDIAANSELASDRDIMKVYFNGSSLNADFPVIFTNQQPGPTNNQRLLYYLEVNQQLFQARTPVIIAAPQPYMKEAESILKKTLKEPSVYRYSKAGVFNIYESLNALRSWLMTDYRLNQTNQTFNE